MAPNANRNNKNNKNKGEAKQGKQRMAGQIWREYDYKSQGGEGFDGKDIKHLQKEGWSHNDIMRAAAASGDVRGMADQRLRKLNTKQYEADDLPDSVREAMAEKFGLAGSLGLNEASFNYLGGGRRDARNWQIMKNESTAEGDGMEVDFINRLGSQYVDEWNHKQSNQRGGGKHGRSVMTWQGINADGTANALTGTFTKRSEKDKEKILTRDITWRLPPDFVASKKPIPATPITDTAKPVEELPEKAPEFNPGDWITPQPPSGGGVVGGGGTGSGGGGGGSVTEPPVEETPYEPEGFERIVNRVYGRPSDWMGDVWKPITAGSSVSGEEKRRAAGSTTFTDALDYWSSVTS